MKVLPNELKTGDKVFVSWMDPELAEMLGLEGPQLQQSFKAKTKFAVEILSITPVQRKYQSRTARYYVLETSHGRLEIAAVKRMTLAS